MVPRRQSAIPADLLAPMRAELQGLRCEDHDENKVGLEAKRHLAKRLKRSPDLADTLVISFAYN